MKKIMTMTCALALASACSAALAHEGSAGFIRGEVGRSDVSTDIGDDDSTSAIFSGGYWFNSNFALEAHLGTLYTDELDADTDFDLVSFGVGIAAKKSFGPNDNGFFIAGRAGVARMTAQVRVDTFDVEEDTHSTKPYFGASVGYDFNRRFGLSLNYDRRQGDFDGIDVDVDTVTLGGEFRF
jgi:hypothetical protein